MAGRPGSTAREGVAGAAGVVEGVGVAATRLSGLGDAGGVGLGERPFFSLCRFSFFSCPPRGEGAGETPESPSVSFGTKSLSDIAGVAGPCAGCESVVVVS